MSEDKQNNLSSLSFVKFERLVGAYGSKPENWPHEHHDFALALLDNSAEARALLGREARLDDLLDSQSETDMRQLAAKMVNDITRLPQEQAARVTDFASYSKYDAKLAVATGLFMVLSLTAGIFGTPYLPVEIFPIGEAADNFALLSFDPRIDW